MTPEAVLIGLALALLTGVVLGYALGHARGFRAGQERVAQDRWYYATHTGFPSGWLDDTAPRVPEPKDR